MAALTDPTPVSIVTHERGYFVVQLHANPADRYTVYFTILKDSCLAGNAPAEAPVSAPRVTTTGVQPAGTGGSAAVLMVLGGFARPLTWGHYWLLRDDPVRTLKNVGIAVPAGSSPNDFMRAACERDPALCKRITAALDAGAAAKVYADATGKATFREVMPRTYFLMVSAGRQGHALPVGPDGGS